MVRNYTRTITKYIRTGLSMAVRPVLLCRAGESIISSMSNQCLLMMMNSVPPWAIVVPVGEQSLQRPVLYLIGMYHSLWANLSGLVLIISVSLHLITPKTLILARWILLPSRRILTISIRQPGQITGKIPWSI